MFHFKSLFAAAAMLGAATSAHAAFVLTLQQVGANVVATGSGSINTTGLSTFGGASFTASAITPNQDYILIGVPGSVSVYAFVSGPSNFGSGGATTYTPIDSGDDFGLINGGQFLFLPAGYTSGSALSDSATFSTETFATLGITPGTYTFNFGSGANADKLTINAVASAVPEPTSLAVLGIPAALGLLRRRRQVIA